ncbi:MAG: transposase [Armatimonadota bacterium]|nr:transposase [Armatimonadota bacterium]
MLWEKARPAFRRERAWRRARTLGVSSLTCLGRHTITGMLTSSGQQFADWTAAYRLFEKERIDMDKLFAPVREAVEQTLPEEMPFIAVLDDTMARKRGRKVKGASWRRDPLGPRFHANFVWSQRFLQTAAILPEAGLSSRARAIPIDLRHCPTPKRPGKWARAQDWTQYRLDQQAMRITVAGLESIRKLRAGLDAQQGGRDRQLIVAVDGGYTNAVVFRNIPERTCLIGRVRKDAKLFAAPQPTDAGRGRPRVYGDPTLTPEQTRQDESIPWRTVRACAGGKVHDFDLKIVDPVRWKSAGDKDLRLIVIRPLAYRPTKGSKLLYREPAYLLCTDPKLSVETTLQAYLWRWEIEVTFREEKTILGLGEAQVRTDCSCRAIMSPVNCRAIMSPWKEGTQGSVREI